MIRYTDSRQKDHNHSMPDHALQAKQLEKRTYGYDFRETSSSSRAQVIKRMPRSDFGVDRDYTGGFRVDGLGLGSGFRVDFQQSCA